MKDIAEIGSGGEEACELCLVCFMLPATQPHVCLQCHALFAPVLPGMFPHFSDLLMKTCFKDADNLVNSTLASRDIRAAQESNKLFELRRSIQSQRG